MIAREIEIKLAGGLEARPVAMLVQVASQYDSSVYLETGTKKVNANEMVELAFERMIGKITKSDIAELCPGLSISAVEKGIAKLLAEGKIEKLGNGRSAFYIKKQSFISSYFLSF